LLAQFRDPQEFRFCHRRQFRATALVVRIAAVFRAAGLAFNCAHLHSWGSVVYFFSPGTPPTPIGVSHFTHPFAGQVVVHKFSSLHPAFVRAPVDPLATAPADGSRLSLSAATATSIPSKVNSDRTGLLLFRRLRVEFPGGLFLAQLVQGPVDIGLCDCIRRSNSDDRDFSH
jgi:hypothetical protein